MKCLQFTKDPYTDEFMTIVTCPGCGTQRQVRHDLPPRYVASKQFYNWEAMRTLEKEEGWKPMPGRAYCPACKKNLVFKAKGMSYLKEGKE